MLLVQTLSPDGLRYSDKVAQYVLPARSSSFKVSLETHEAHTVAPEIMKDNAYLVKYKQTQAFKCSIGATLAPIVLSRESHGI